MNTLTTTTPTEQVTRIEITHPRQRLNFIPRLFASPLADQMAANFLQRYSN